jgi:hypothetical protein
MKCKVCGKRTNYDESFGRDTFIVCNNCVSDISKICELEKFQVYGVILTIGFKREGKYNA